jgi:hypothetical protein
MFFVYLAGLTDFDFRMFRSVHKLWTLILTTDIFEMGLTAGVTGQQGMLTPLRHLILPSHDLSEVRVALHSIL